MIWSIFLILVPDALCSLWSHYDSDGCPNCVVFTTDTNFSSILSFESKVLVGAKNSIYEIDFSEEISTQYSDQSEPVGREKCYQNLGEKEDECQNYYKVILQLNKADLFICGTSAFHPACGVRRISDLSYSSHSNDGLNICPANPRASTTYLKLKDSLYGFAGTERASSSDYTISLINLRYDSYKVEATTKPNNHWLNKPEFVYSFEYGDHVYFVMKEIAVEVLNIEQIYSRVVRICKNDRGGNIFFDGYFMTFIKARIYCSYTRPGQSPYDFNEIGGAYFLDGYLYGIFSGPTSVIETGSVLCKFSMQDIVKVFEGKAKRFERGTFKDEPQAYPFNCVEGRSSVNATKHQLMASSIFSSNPLFYSAVQMKRLVVSSIQISNETSIIANTGADGGKIIRIGFREGDWSRVRHRTLDLQHKGPVQGLSVPEDDPTQVFIMSHSWLGYVPLQLPCSFHSTCQSCQTAFPYCGWCSLDSSEPTCTTAATCGGSWQSPYDSCPALETFKTKPSNITVTLTESKPVAHVHFGCESYQSYVAPSWSRLGSQIPSTAAITQRGKHLLLKVESYTDAGSYICSLKGDAGNVHSSAALTVLVSPSFTKLSPMNVTVPKGQDVTLTCVCDGNPKPVVAWKLRNGAPLPESARSDQTTGSLKLIRIVPADEGRYFCEIDNGVGNPKSSHDIVVGVTDRNPVGPDSNATKVAVSAPFDFKKIIIIICCSIILIVVVAGIVHFVVKKRKRKKAAVPVMYPLAYQEQMYGDLQPHTPTSVVSPQYMEEQNPAYRGFLTQRPVLSRHYRNKMPFDWNQQHLLNQQLLTQQMLAAQMGVATSYHLQPRGDITTTSQEEPPPAYQAEIELHQPPVTQVRRPPPSDHFFTPVHDSPGYSMTASVDSQPGCSGRNSDNGYDVTDNRPPPRGPTPPPRSDIRPKPACVELESSAEDRLLVPDNPPPIHEQDTTPPDPVPSEALPFTSQSDEESVHEYERIGLLVNTTCNPATLVEQDNSSRGSSLLQT